MHHHSLSKASFVSLFVCLFPFCALIHGKKFYARVFNLQDMDDKERFCKAFTGEKEQRFSDACHHYQTQVNKD